jgi:DNA-binding FadR family transcriptional regulator
MKNGSKAVGERLLDGIRSGAWRDGEHLPSERELMDRFGVSRVAVRESLCQLHGLGVIDRSQGRRARVRHLDSGALGRLFPVILAHDGVKTHRHVFEVRLALETRSAALAALRRSDPDCERIEAAAAAYGARVDVDPDRPPVDADFAFHCAIAEATGNPLFPKLLEAIAGFVLYAQSASCGDDSSRLRRAHEAHSAIAAAIRRRDPDRAQLEMSHHLHLSAERFQAERREEGPR